MKRDEAIQLLRGGQKGIEEWNRLRPTPMVTFEGGEVELKGGFDLSGADLHGAKMGFANLERVQLIGANLTDTELHGADLSGADLSRASLCDAQLVGARLKFTNLRGADLRRADLSDAVLLSASLNDAKLDDACLLRSFLLQADLSAATLVRVNAQGACLIKADLRGADLSFSDFGYANLSEADLSNANLPYAVLRGTSLVNTDLSKANLTGCKVYGVSAWGVQLAGAKETDLVITDEGEGVITLDSLEMAQFIHLLLRNAAIRNIIDTITSRVVLILGRFTPERKTVLEVIRGELRSSGYVPILFDFERPRSRDFIETVCTLAHLARFVVAEFTDAKIVLEEVPHIVRTVAVPLKPLLLDDSGDEPVTLLNLRRNHVSVLSTHRYKDIDDLQRSFRDDVVLPAEQKAKEIVQRPMSADRSESGMPSDEWPEGTEVWTVIDPFAGEAQSEPTLSEISGLPLWAIVVFSTRCARRVEKLLAKSPRGIRKTLFKAVEVAESAAVTGKVSINKILDAYNAARRAYDKLERSREALENGPHDHREWGAALHAGYAAGSFVNTLICAIYAAEGDRTKAAEAALQAARAACHASKWLDFEASANLSSRYAVEAINGVARDFLKLRSAAAEESWNDDTRIGSVFLWSNSDH